MSQIDQLNHHLSTSLPTFTTELLSKRKEEIITLLFDDIKKILSTYLNLYFSPKEDFSKSIGYSIVRTSNMEFSSLNIEFYIKSQDYNDQQFREIGCTIEHNFEIFLNRVLETLNPIFSRGYGKHDIWTNSLKFEVNENQWSLVYKFIG